MIFPDIEEIASNDIARIGEGESVAEALGRMLARDIRDIVVETADPGRYGLFTVRDVIAVGARPEGLSTPIAAAGYRLLHCVPMGLNLLGVFNELSGDEDYLGVLDGDALVGLVSYTDIISSIDPHLLVERQRIGDLFDRRELKALSAQTPLGDVLLTLSHVDDAVVLTEDGRLTGILTTKDAMRLIGARADMAVPAGRYMSSPVDTFATDLTIRDALAILKERHYKRLVITEPNGRLVGVITQKELVSLAFNRWSELLRSHANELHELVTVLERRAVNLEKLATTDHLTGITNRSKFENLLEAEIGRYYRYKTVPFSVLMMDIDHFKEVNDTHGHLVGDEVLKEFARHVAGCVRQTDTFARWGGEEFCLLMPMTTGTHAEQFAERLRAQVQAHRVAGIPPITISIGVAEYRSDEPMHALMARTDKALYQAKSGGRNRVVRAES